MAFGVAIEAARGGAEKISDLVDKKMQDEFDKIAKISTNTLIVLFIRDLLMGLLHCCSLGSAENLVIFHYVHVHCYAGVI